MSIFHTGRRQFLGAILGALGNASCASISVASEVTAEAFRNEVLSVGRRRYASPAMQPGSGLDIIWGPHHLYLDNLYANTRALPPEQREHVILAWLALFSPEADAKAQRIKDAANVWAQARPLLRPKLIPKRTVEAAKTLVWQPFFSVVVAGYAIDLGDKDLYVTDEKFAKWRVPLAEVHNVAIDNLDSMSANMTIKTETPNGETGGFTSMTSGDGYDAARILLPKLRERLLDALGPSLFAAIPSRDVLMLWSANYSYHRSAVQRAYDLSRLLPHALTDEIFAVTKAGVRPATVAETAR